MASIREAFLRFGHSIPLQFNKSVPIPYASTVLRLCVSWSTARLPDFDEFVLQRIGRGEMNFYFRHQFPHPSTHFDQLQPNGVELRVGQDRPRQMLAAKRMQ